MQKLKSIYFPNEEDVDRNLFYPVFDDSSSCRCMTGYFTSGALRELSFSISHFLTFKSQVIKFLISPNLTAQDTQAFKKSVEIDENLIPLLFPDFDLSEKTLRTKSIEALSFLVATHKIEIRVAIQETGLFHTKAWMFDTSSGRVAIHGSGNATESGLSRNFEQLTVSCEFEGASGGSQIIDALSERFDEIWEGSYRGIESYKLTQNTISALSTIYDNLPKADWQSETFLEIFSKQLKKEEVENAISIHLKIPSWLNYTKGDFSHQGEAVHAWQDNNYRGILSVATGGGKTLTSLIAATLVQNKGQSLLVIVAVPTKLLVAQWGEDIREFGIEPILGLGLSGASLAKEIPRMVRNLRSKHSNCEIMVVTHEALKMERIINALVKAEEKTPTMLIGDEVHNLGSIGFQQSAPNVFRYRLGLSATVERQFDDSGTKFLYEYFGPVVYEFSVAQAIGTCLVGFQYFVHEVQLLESEKDEWIDLTLEIRKLSYASDLDDGVPAKDRWKLLCLKRRRIVEGAIGKVTKLSEILPPDSSEIRRALIFCTDKAPEQLIGVNLNLMDRGIRFHQVTQDETKNRNLLDRIVDAFSDESIQVLTSKRVLDEGFNVPQTEVAYLLASSTVKRQWVQRLGRILRKSESTEKSEAHIHDFIVMPAEIDRQVDNDLQALIRGEISRIQFFNELSSNGMEKNGAIDLMDKLIHILEGV